MNKVKIGNIEIGERKDPVFIAGPCVIEDYEMFDKTARFLNSLAVRDRVILKCSYDKANRTSAEAFRGPGLEKGMSMISEIKNRYGLPVLADVHCRQDVDIVAGTVDCIQVPAFLCRQTDLLLAAANTGKPVNIKKGQFMSPWAMRYQAEKIINAGNSQVLLTERGSTFGYDELIVDMRSILIMRREGIPVLFDATHSQQRPPTDIDSTGGRKEFIIPLARAAAAAGADGIYCEIHPDPENAKSDSGTQLGFGEFEELVYEVSRVW
ncbi:MAG: 3-deoxy-8-phosphooctulonate synthase [Elusimicrobiota bacterium]